MEKDKSWKKADYPNAIPSWHKRSQRYKETTEEMMNRVTKQMTQEEWDKLAIIGKEEK